MHPLHAYLPLIALLALDDQTYLVQLRPPPITKQAPFETLELGGIYTRAGPILMAVHIGEWWSCAGNAIGSRLHGGSANRYSTGPDNSPARRSWSIAATKDPVIYTLGDGGVLNGAWADGSATATLVRIATPASKSRPLRPGNYKAERRNPDGTRYAGTITLTKRGDVYQLSWAVGQTRRAIRAAAPKKRLGSFSTPVIYALTDEGSSSGFWDAGRGEETTTPAE